VLPSVVDEIRARVDSYNNSNSPADIVALARDIAPRISDVELVDLVAQLTSEHFGLGPLNELLRIPNVTDVIVNGHADAWIDRGHGLERMPSPWSNETEVRDFATQLAVANSRRLDELNPYVDVQLRSGIRCHIIAPPLSTSGTQISLRVPYSSLPTLEELMRNQPMAIKNFVKWIIRSKKSVMICGGTGSGKTTLLAAMLHETSQSERIVVIEDLSEISIHHPHVVLLQSRHANSEGVGEVTMRALVRQSLRMRPDRIVVGEIRGGEILELFAALNTGHRGCAATIHANSAQDVITRVQLLGALNGLSDEATHLQLASAIDIVIELNRCGSDRNITEIGILKFKSGRCQYESIVSTVPELVIHPEFRGLIEDMESEQCA
jgi:pilus assembly protein CpaF